ncbi:MAG: MmgE/PrpD family protein [Thermodesulfobacteriota bacterium]|nr:MmgE/PrpD family protein [Thermodesulfobacteriota bacterium]
MSTPTHELNDTVTHLLAQFVVDLHYEDIPKNVIEFTKVCVLDLFGSAFAAIGTPILLAARNFSEEALGHGAVTRWDTGEKTSIVGATWVNSVLASAIDIDDGHRLAIGHPGSVIIPPTIAMAEHEHAHGKQLLEAVIAGYEVAIRLSHSRDPLQIENVTTGGWGGFGAAIAAGKLILNTASEIENTLGLVAMYGPRLPGTFPGGRRMVKEGISWAAVVGVSSALLARSGFMGPQNVFDYLPLYHPQKIFQGLGKDFLILKTYFKRYPCCRWLHPIIESLLELMKEGAFQPSHIKTIHIQTFSRAFTLPNRIHPQTLEEAQFSIPFCSALAMMKSEEGFYHIRMENLDDPRVIQLAEKVHLEHQPIFDESFPEKIFSKITVETSNGKVEKLVSSVKGDSDNPLTEQELEDKYFHYALPVLGGKKASLLKDYVKNLEEVSIEDLMRTLDDPKRAST